MTIEDEEHESQLPLKKIKRFYSSQNHHCIPTLPKEIVIEILFRLPVKCILQCKSVCKSWYSLISDHHFVKSHLSFSTSNNKFALHRLRLFGSTANPVSCSLYDVMHDKSFKLLELDYPLKGSKDFARIIGSCNGLLLLKVGKDALFICNPTTRTSSNRLPYFGFQASLYGFGYDASSEDYKVVVIPNLFQKGNNRVKMYSLKSAKWKKIGDFPLSAQEICSFRDCGVFSNGALHWVGRSLFNSVWSSRIISLDLATEAYGEALQPVYDGFIKEIGALGEWLFLVCTNRENRADVWMMKVYGDPDSWTKLVSIQDMDIQRSLIPCFANDEKIILICGRKLVLYDAKNGSFSQIKNYGGSFVVLPWTIVESLVLPGGPRRQSTRRR